MLRVFASILIGLLLVAGIKASFALVAVAALVFMTGAIGLVLNRVTARLLGQKGWDYDLLS